MLFFWALEVHVSVWELLVFSGTTDTVAGNEFRGISYLRYRPEQTSTVTVEYVVSRPPIARIEGGSYSPFVGTALMAAIFPLLGLIMLAFPLYY